MLSGGDGENGKGKGKGEGGKGGDDGTPKRDLNEIFDLDRKKLTRSMVERLESVMRDMDSARDDLKAVIAECREAQFSPLEIRAMKRIAKLRKDDKVGAAREELEALERIGHAIGLALFEWAAGEKD